MALRTARLRSLLSTKGTRRLVGSPWRTRSMAVDVWAYNVALICIAVLVYVFGVSRLPQQGGPVRLPFLALALIFSAESAFRVHIHFRRNAQSYSLSEIPLIIGLFFVAPDELILARLMGAAIGLGLFRRQPPIKLFFNLASFALEAETAVLLFNRVLPTTDITAPAAWLWILLTMVIVAAIGFVLSAIVITLAEDQVKRRQWVLPAVLTIGGGVANASLGLEVVAAVSRNVSEMLLLLLPVLTLAAAYALYTREFQKRQQLQYLYQSSDLLQRVTAQEAAIPELLRQLCQVFRAEVARIILLPAATSSNQTYTIAVRRGATSESHEPVHVGFLDRFSPLLDETGRGFIAVPPRTTPDLEAWLGEQDLRNAICTSLQSDRQLLGALVVGNRLSDVSTFDADDLTLLETFAAQASVAVQNTRLGSRLEHQAFHDPLTGLANRALFTDRLEHALTRRDDHHEALAVIFLDLDDFKMVNDTLGHGAGDELLCGVAERLQTVLRPSDTAARFGGDEFAVLLEEAAEAYSIIGVAERIVAALKPHFVIAGREVAVHASVGVATAAAREIDAEELLRRADVAMYRAKTQGKGSFEIFEPGMQEVVTRRLEVKTDLERAIARSELLVHYQPIVDIATERPVGVEALVRWNHPRWGLVMPSEFVGVAEETGLIYEVGLYVLREACAQCQQWQTAFPDQPAFTVSVNVSPRQLRNQRFVSDVWRVLSQTGLHPSRLVLEITESFMVEDREHAGERLRELKALGVRISIDDFGTGYSSLAVLQELPIDILKIDKAFVDHIVDDPRRAAFAQAIIRMGKTLGLGLVSEGVEDAAQAERLLALGCGLAQGFHFARPSEAAVITRMLHGAARSPLDGVRGAADGPGVVVLPVDGAGGQLGRFGGERRAAQQW